MAGEPRQQPSPTGVRIAGDDYQWLVAWLQCVVALDGRQKDRITSVGVEVPEVAPFDDVVVRRESGLSTYIQVKYTVDLRSPVNFEYLTEATSLLKKTAALWTEWSEAERTSTRLILLTNRAPDSRDPLIKGRDSRSGLLLPNAGRDGPTSERGRARDLWSQNAGLDQDQLLALLRIWQFDLAQDVRNLEELADARMGAVGLRTDNDALPMGIEWIRRQVKDGIREFTSEKIIEAVGDLGLYVTTNASCFGSVPPAERPLDELLDVQPDEDGDLPKVTDLTPYRLGATKSQFGDPQTYRQKDPYVPRTFNDVDKRLAAALGRRRLVLVHGDSKVGKTRTCYEALRSGWPDARLLAPLPGTFEELVARRRVRYSTDTIVVWLDNLPRFFNDAKPLTQQLCDTLFRRKGTTIMVGTLTTKEYSRLWGDSDSSDDANRSTNPTYDAILTYNTRTLLDQAETIELFATTIDPDEKRAANAVYPGQDRGFGLAAGLAGSEPLLRHYRNAETNEPLQHAVIGVAIDWTRVGRHDGIPEPKLKELASQRLRKTRRYLDFSGQDLDAAVKAAQDPQITGRRVAALTPLPGGNPEYEADGYLIAADEGQRPPRREIPDDFWRAALSDTDGEIAVAIGLAAHSRNATKPAFEAFGRAADLGHPRGMSGLGFLLAKLDPPDLKAAHRRFKQAAELGDLRGMFNLAYLLAEWLDLPDLKGARDWYEQAAAKGDSDAMFNLAYLLAEQLDPPDLKAARHWYEKLVATGHANAKTILDLIQLKAG